MNAAIILDRALEISLHAPNVPHNYAATRVELLFVLYSAV